VRKATERFQKEIRSHKFPKLLDQTRGTLTISGGLAGFPWDGRTPQELMEKADAMAMQSKRQGKNVLTFGPGALQEGTAGI
jgi:GGDEF domain-containing protein